MSKRPQPLSAFSRRLLNLLLKAAIEPQRFYAELDHSPPQLFSKGTSIPPGSRDCARSTRWHIIVFSSPSAALRFKEFQRLAQRLHHLRKLLKEENHPDASVAYSTRVSIDDRLGLLEVGPSDAHLDAILGTAASPTSPSSEVSTSQLPFEDEFNDPLDSLGD